MPASRAILADIHEQNLDPRVPYRTVGAKGRLKIRAEEVTNSPDDSSVQQPAEKQVVAIVEEIPVLVIEEPSLTPVQDNFVKVEPVEIEVKPVVVDHSKKKKGKKDVEIIDH